MKTLNKLFALSLLISLQSHAEVVQVSPHGFIVKNEIVTTAPAATVWQALINDVDKWWPKDHSWWGDKGTFSIEPRAGGCFCEVSGDKSAEHMHIAFVDPEKLLRMTGGLGPLQGMGMYGALDWTFSQDGASTKVTLTYRVIGINPDGFEKWAPGVAHVQGLQLNGLKTFVDSQ